MNVKLVKIILKKEYATQTNFFLKYIFNRSDIVLLIINVIYSSMNKKNNIYTLALRWKAGFIGRI